MKKGFYFGFARVLLILVLLQGCNQVVQVGTTVSRGIGATSKAVRPMTDQEEYYVGRAVAATILGQYRLYSSERLTSYVNAIGQAAALASDRPFTYGGYHFAVLDTDEVNALSCPGGIIFITRGMVQKTKNEEELAAVLSHEVAHVSHKDGLSSIQKSRWVEAASILGSEAARQMGGANLTQLVSLFEGSVNDVVKTLLVKGFSRQQEEAADQGGLTFLHRLGYDPYGLTDILEKLAQQQTSGGGQGIFATHPGMNQRLAQSRAILSRNQWSRTNEPRRDQRFRDSGN
jgi:predicted Zn-dependent protease